MKQHERHPARPKRTQKLVFNEDDIRIALLDYARKQEGLEFPVPSGEPLRMDVEKNDYPRGEGPSVNLYWEFDNDPPPGDAP